MDAKPSRVPSGKIRPLVWWTGLALWGAVVLLIGLAFVAREASPIPGDPSSLFANAWSRVQSWTAAIFGAAQPSGATAAPELNLPLYDGGVLRLSDHRGKLVVVNFWASWCVPCRAEMPRLASASETFKDRGVVFVGVDVGDSPENGRAFLGQFGIRYANGPDQSLTIAKTYGVTVLPATFFVDRDGRIRQRVMGEIQPDQLTRSIETILS
jgi:thiol-disulfide isomerase/thioredoxin